jgi:hypothetical protein
MKLQRPLMNPCFTCKEANVRCPKILAIAPGQAVEKLEKSI